MDLKRAGEEKRMRRKKEIVKKNNERNEEEIMGKKAGKNTDKYRNLQIRFDPIANR